MIVPDAIKVGPARAVLLGLLVALTAGSCAHHLGPKTIVRDRFDYSTTLADSWKEQTLLNIVKLRYLDPPIFLDVGQIVSGYSLETAVSAGGTLSSPTAIQGDALSLGAAGRFTERPTITYSPLTGEKFLRGMMTPIAPRAVFFLVQSGFAADFVLELTTRSLAGMRNASMAGQGARGADPEFRRALELLRVIHASGVFGLHVEPGPTTTEATVVTFRRESVPEQLLRDSDELKRLLGLTSGQHQFQVVYSALPGTGEQLTIETRSVLHILMALAAGVDVPPEHVEQQRALGAPPASDGPELFRVHSGPEAPADAFTAVRYRDLWFWIDDRDLRSKRTFALIMFVFSLADTGGAERLPILSIPTQ